MRPEPLIESRISDLAEEVAAAWHLVVSAVDAIPVFVE
jgi:hypothetical protein